MHLVFLKILNYRNYKNYEKVITKYQITYTYTCKQIFGCFMHTPWRVQ